MSIQLLSLVPDRDCTLKTDLQEIGKLHLGAVDCNRLAGMVIPADEYAEVLAALAEKGWTRVGGERGGPEGLATVYLDNASIARTPPWRSPEMAAYLATNHC